MRETINSRTGNPVPSNSCYRAAMRRAYRWIADGRVARERERGGCPVEGEPTFGRRTSDDRAVNASKPIPEIETNRRTAALLLLPHISTAERPGSGCGRGGSGSAPSLRKQGSAVRRDPAVGTTSSSHRFIRIKTVGIPGETRDERLRVQYYGIVDPPRPSERSGGRVDRRVSGMS